ncbi:MAG: hypothetical protein FWG91_06765 [Lachnospiraceae bacterium]|nr:hypothetical protein [Lachnospiraceae bacterium]
MANFLKFILCVLVYSIVYMLVIGLIPFSPAFTEITREVSETQTTASTLMMLLPIIWNCFTAYFIIRNANVKGKKLFRSLMFVMFFIVYFFPQALGAEAADVHGMPWHDFILLSIPGLISLLATLPLMVKFFQNKNVADVIGEHEKLKFKQRYAIKIGLGGLLLAGIYILFLLTVQRNVAEYRVFYQDTAWMQAAHGENWPGFFYPLFSIPFFRGIINGVLILPLLPLIKKSKLVFTTAICLVFLAPAIAFGAPNPLFPDTVRLMLMASMIITMLSLGIFTGKVMWKEYA